MKTLKTVWVYVWAALLALAVWLVFAVRIVGQGLLTIVLAPYNALRPAAAWMRRSAQQMEHAATRSRLWAGSPASPAPVDRRPPPSPPPPPVKYGVRSAVVPDRIPSLDEVRMEIQQLKSEQRRIWCSACNVETIAVVVGVPTRRELFGETVVFESCGSCGRVVGWSPVA